MQWLDQLEQNRIHFASTWANELLVCSARAHRYV